MTVWSIYLVSAWDDEFPDPSSGVLLETTVYLSDACQVAMQLATLYEKGVRTIRNGADRIVILNAKGRRAAPIILISPRRVASLAG